MYRFLPLLLLFTACAGDPLALHEAELNLPAPEDGLTSIDYASAGPLTETKEILASHEDLNLKMSFRAEAGTKAELRLQGRYALALPSLALSGATPRTNLNPTPGVWQDLEIVFISAKEDSPALLPAVYLNGGLVYFQETLTPEPGTSSGPLVLAVEAGAVELSDLRYSDQGGEGSSVNEQGDIVLNMPLLRYEYYDLPDVKEMVRNWAQLEPTANGYIHRFDLHTIRDKGSDFAIRFFGKLDVPVAGEYTFRTFSPAFNAVYLDGVKIINRDDAKADINTEGVVKLTEGAHDVRVDFVQGGGWHRFDLAFVGPNGKEGFVNTMEEGKAIATPAAANPKVLETDDYPYLLRSFLYFPAPRVYEIATKRTHVISVGEADGPHYSLDLQSGAILQAWRGGFADTHDMWDGRGEPQVMRPLGPVIPFDGAPQWAFLAGDDDPWPTTLAEGTDFHHVRHTLDEADRPTFEFRLDGHSLSDKLMPENGGLVRELTHSVGGNGSIFTQVIAARQITETAPGEYETQGPGLKITLQSYDGNRLVLQHGGGVDRLVAEIPAKGHLTYRLDW